MYIPILPRIPQKKPGIPTSDSNSPRSPQIFSIVVSHPAAGHPRATHGTLFIVPPIVA